MVTRHGKINNRILPLIELAKFKLAPFEHQKGATNIPVNGIMELVSRSNPIFIIFFHFGPFSYFVEAGDKRTERLKISPVHIPDNLIDNCIERRIT